MGEAAKNLESRLSTLEKNYNTVRSENAELKEQNSALKTEADEAKGKVVELEKRSSGSADATIHFAGRRSDSDEQRALKALGTSHIASILRKNVADPRYFYMNPDQRQAMIQLKHDIDCARLYCQGYEKSAPMDTADIEDPDKGYQPVRVKNILDNSYAREMDLKARLKAFGTEVAGEGAEWIMTAISSNYMEEYRLLIQVPGLFRELPMPTKDFEMPFQDGKTVARGINEDTEATPVTFGTGVIQLRSKKLVEYYRLPTELTEDSMVNFISVGRQEVLESQLRARERIIVDGDITATHMDSDVTGADDARKQHAGLRKVALDNSANGAVVDFQNGFITYPRLIDLLKASGDFGVLPSQSGFVVSAQGNAQMLELEQVVTIDKFGPQAVVRSGGLPSVLGRPIAVSEWMREDLNDLGVHDGVTTDRTVIHLVNFQRFMAGRRRPIQIRAARDPRPEHDRFQIISYSRWAFAGKAQGPTETSSVIGVNVKTGPSA